MILLADTVNSTEGNTESKDNVFHFTSFGNYIFSILNNGKQIKYMEDQILFKPFIE